MKNSEETGYLHQFEDSANIPGDTCLALDHQNTTVPLFPCLQCVQAAFNAVLVQWEEQLHGCQGVWRI